MISQRIALLTLVVLGGGGWFAVSWKGMGAAPGQAVNEAIGAALGLLILVAVIGVIRQRGRGAGG